jgi:dihydroflavonol-4-reductase
MGKTLVTGGTGFIGSHVVRALTRRGDELRLLVRKPSRLAALGGLELDSVTGEVGDRDVLRRAMDGVSRVFHVAGITSMRPRHRELLFEVNVTGTRNVISEARRAGVERMVFTSSVGAIGPAKRGGAADETQPFSGAELGIAYVDSKHEAEVDALRAAAEGLPLVCVNPTFVLGPHDPNPSGTSNALVRRFLLRQIPVYVDGGLNIVDVRDIAAGHLLADERGRVGERYILGGRNFTLARLFADLGRISGVDPPPIKLPGSVAVAGVEAAKLARVPIPTTVDEVRSGTQWWTYRSEKAQSELGFSSRPHEETLEDTVAWLRTQLGDRVGRSQPYNLPLDVAGRALRIAGRMVGR